MYLSKCNFKKKCILIHENYWFWAYCVKFVTIEHVQFSRSGKMLNNNRKIRIVVKGKGILT